MTELDVARVPQDHRGGWSWYGMGAAGLTAHLRLLDVSGRRSHRRDRAPGRPQPYGDNRARLPARTPPSHHYRRRSDRPNLELGWRALEFWMGRLAGKRFVLGLYPVEVLQSE